MAKLKILVAKIKEILNKDDDNGSGGAGAVAAPIPYKLLIKPV